MSSFGALTLSLSGSYWGKESSRHAALSLRAELEATNVFSSTQPSQDETEARQHRLETDKKPLAEVKDSKGGAGRS